MAVGAHPSLDDRENFGRTELPVSAEDVFALVTYQLGAFHGDRQFVRRKSSPREAHGALYNMAARDACPCRGGGAGDPGGRSLAPPFLPGRKRARRGGRGASIFVSRGKFSPIAIISPTARSFPRTRPDALLHDPEEAAERVLRISRKGGHAHRWQRDRDRSRNRLRSRGHAGRGRLCHRIRAITWPPPGSRSRRPQPNEWTPPNDKLQRGLGPLDATMIVIGSMIGSGIFITSAESTRLLGAPGWLLLAWTMAGLLTIAGALCCAELAAMLPRAGGQYVFLRSAYGPSVGFLFGWTLFLVIQTGTIAAVAIAFAKFAGVFFSPIANENYLVRPIHLFGGYAISLSTEQLVAVLLISLLTWLNTRGLEVGRFIQNTFTLAKTVALLGLIAIGLSLGWSASSAARAATWWNPWANGWSPQMVEPGLTTTGFLALLVIFGKAMVGPIFAQTAWTNVTFTGSEIRDPGRTLPRALLIGCGTVVTLYVFANLVYLATLSLGEIAHAPQGRVAVASMRAMFGGAGEMAMAAAILISTFGCDNGLILAGARVYYAMAKDGLFFRAIARTNRQQVPAAALVAQGFWAACLTLPRTVSVDASGAIRYGNVYTQLLEYIVAADLVFYILLVVAVVVLRRKMPELTRPYLAWGYPIVPTVAIALAGGLIIDLAMLAPATCGIGFAIVLSGLPVFMLWRSPGGKRTNY